MFARRTLCFLLVGFCLTGPVLAEEESESPSREGSQAFKLSGYAQVLASVWKEEEINSLRIRRARLTLSGEILNKLRYKVTSDLTKSPILLDALLEYAFSDFVTLRIGQFVVPFSLENNTSAADVATIDRSRTEETFTPGRDIGSSGRDIGIALFGRFAILEYSLGLFNGSGINRADTNSHKDIGGRIVIRPLSFLSLGGSAYWGKQDPEHEGPLVKRNRKSLECTVYWTGATLTGEYIQARDGDVSRAGWYVQAAYDLLRNRLQGIVKYDALDLDRNAEEGRRNSFTLGMNWILRGRTKLQINYVIHRTPLDGMRNAVFLAQFQAAF